MNGDDRLTTADLAHPREDTRGRAEENMIGREPQPVTGDGSAHAEIKRDGDDAMRGRSDSRPMPSVASERSQADSRAALFAGDDARGFHDRWMDVQAAFVDEPRAAVERADSLVAEVMTRLAEGFANERAGLERQWDRGDNVTTEDLRLALQRYRQFFDRLLKV
jgi:hypothetical protein